MKIEVTTRVIARDPETGRRRELRSGSHDVSEAFGRMLIAEGRAKAKAGRPSNAARQEGEDAGANQPAPAAQRTQPRAQRGGKGGGKGKADAGAGATNATTEGGDNSAHDGGEDE